MKKGLTQWISAGVASILLCACGGGVADGDYAGAFQEYAQSQLKAKVWTLTADENLQPDQIQSILVEELGKITVADSLAIARQEAIDTYISTEKNLKHAMDEAEHNYKLEANAQFAYRRNYEKELKRLQAAHGNDLKFASKIKSYQEKIASMPKDMESYIAFDKARDFSYVRLFEKARDAHQTFSATSAEEYVAKSTAQYTDRDTTEVLGVKGRISFVTPAGKQSAIAVFNESPTYVKSIAIAAE